MILFQQDYTTRFERKIIKKISKKTPNRSEKIFIGFEYGFFKGCNIYYGNLQAYKKAKKIYDAFVKEKIFVRLFTNLACEYDVVIFLGYTNRLSERVKIYKKLSKIIKALSSL